MNKVAHYLGGSSDKVYIVSIVKTSTGGFKVVAKWGGRGKSMQSQAKGTFPNFSSAEAEADSIMRTKYKKGYEDIESLGYSGPLTMTNSWLTKYLEDDATKMAAPSTADEIRKAILPTVVQQAKDFLRDGLKINAIKAVRTATNSDLKPAKEYIEELEKEVKAEQAAAAKTAAKVEEDTFTDGDDFEVVCVDNLGIEESFDEGVTYVAEKHEDSDMFYVYDRNAVKQECFKSRFKRATSGVSSMNDMRLQPQAV